jgi:hypothetical protein
MDGHVVGLCIGTLYAWACCMEGRVLWMNMYAQHVLWIGTLYGWACCMDGFIIFVLCLMTEATLDPKNLCFFKKTT